MKLTLNENIKLNYSFIKKIEEETLVLIPDEYNFLHNDIRLYTLMALSNELSNEGIGEIINGEEGDIIEKIELYIEPFFEEVVSNNDKVQEIFDYVVDDLSNYLYERMEDNRHITSSLSGMLDLFSKLDIQQLIPVINNVIDSAPKMLESVTNVKEDEEQDDINNIENITNDKLKDMIKSFEHISEETAE